jgi:hypothetical protein
MKAYLSRYVFAAVIASAAYAWLVSPLLPFPLAEVPLPIWKTNLTKSRMTHCRERIVTNASLKPVILRTTIKARVGNDDDPMLTVWNGPGPYNTEACSCDGIFTGIVNSILLGVHVNVIALFDWRQPEWSEIGSNIGGRFLTDVCDLKPRLNCFRHISVCPKIDAWMVGHEPRPISPSGGIFGITNASNESEEAYHSNNSGKERYTVKPFGYPNLPFPEALLFGSMLVFFGIRLSNKGIIDGPFGYLIGGWLMAVVGGVLLALPMTPYFVEFFSYVFGLRQW